MDSETYADVPSPARSWAICAVNPVITPSATNRSTRAYALAREMCTRSARDRIDVRASLMSSLRISRSGPSSSLTERPAPDGLGVFLADIWSVTNPPASRMSPILSLVWDNSLEGETIECHIVDPARAGTTLVPYQMEADALTTDTSTSLPQ